MRVAPSYFHSLNGRLRIKIAEVKDSPARALEIESQLLELDGIKHTKANPTTGNVLVIYDHDRIGQAEIIDVLKTLGYLKHSANTRQATPAGQELIETLAKKLIKNIAHSMVDAALHSLVSALLV